LNTRRRRRRDVEERTNKKKNKKQPAAAPAAKLAPRRGQDLPGRIKSNRILPWEFREGAAAADSAKGLLALVQRPSNSNKQEEEQKTARSIHGLMIDSITLQLFLLSKSIR